MERNLTSSVLFPYELFLGAIESIEDGLESYISKVTVEEKEKKEDEKNAEISFTQASW